MPIFAEISRERRIIKDPEPFSFEYHPRKIVHRDVELKELGRIFFPVFNSAVSGSAILTGSVGTGKTIVSRELGREMAGYGRTVGKTVIAVHVNARLKRTDNAILHSVLTHDDIKPNYPDRGFSFGEMLGSLKKFISDRGVHLLIMIDEADAVLRGGSEIVYTLSRINEDDRYRGSVSILLISQQPILSYMDAASRDTFKSNTVRLAPYTPEQLADILGERIERGLVPDSISEEEVTLIADIASESGSARRAIEVLEKAARGAESRGRTRIDAEAVRTAASSLSQIDNRVLELEPGPRAVLLAIARRLREAPYTYTGELEAAYRQVCEEIGRPAVAHTQFWKYIKQLENWGLISTKIGNKGMSGNTTVVYLRDIPAGELETLLLETFP